MEYQWESALATYDNFTLITVLTFVIHETVYFGRYLPFYIIESMPSMRKYKLQPVRCLHACRRSKF